MMCTLFGRVNYFELMLVRSIIFIAASQVSVLSSFQLIESIETIDVLNFAEEIKFYFSNFGPHGRVDDGNK